MSSLRKTVELATKPKRAAPKAKYIDPIVQATFNQDGALQEIVRTLSTRMRDANTTVVFKSHLVLHTIMRAGSLEAVFSYLASSSISTILAHHESANISAYGAYLATRIKAYANLKRDVIRDKSDRRAANRLRKLSVEQGLLRETREIQRMIAALVETKFFNDDVDDDVSMSALRLLVKDCLVLFQAVNEAVINILENYFSLAKSDAQTALKIYKTFCRDTERVVGFLGTAKKLYNVLNVPIPNIKHAPVSLAKSLEEYLNDPNFEQNRSEYKENKRIADGGTPRASKPTTPTPTASTSTPTAASSAPPSSQPAPSAAPKSFTDFFDSIEQAQTPMFNPGTGSPTMTYFQQQAAYNPFAAPQHTGLPFSQPGMLPQATGMPFGQPQLMPQMTGYGAPNPFLQPQATGFVQQQQPQFMQPQMTGMLGANPFRQSMMMTGMGAPNAFLGAQPTGYSSSPSMPNLQPQATGAFGRGGSPFGQPQQQQQQQQQPFLAAQPTGNPFQRPQSTFSPSYSSPLAASNAPGIPSLGAPSSPFGNSQFSSNSSAPPPVPTAAPTPAPLTAQKTGSRNPFAPAGTLIPQNEPPVPKGPSMNQIASTYQQQPQQQLQPQQTGNQGQLQPQQTSYGGASNGQQQQQQQQAPAKQDAFSAFLAKQNAERDAAASGSPGPLIAQKTGGLFASIASDLARNDTSSPSSAAASTSLPPFSSSTLSTPFSSLSLGGNNTTTPSALSPSYTGAPSAPFLNPQSTGFAGSNVKPFSPTSTFGNELATQLGSPSSPAPLSSQPTGYSSAFASSFASSPSPAPAPQQSTSPAPLQPQQTGYNPFAGSKLPPLNTPLSSGLTGTTTTGAAPTWTTFGGGGGQGGAQTGNLI